MFVMQNSLQHFPFLIMKIRKPKATALIYSFGKMVCSFVAIAHWSVFVCGFLNIEFKFQILCGCLWYDHVPNIPFAKPNNFTLYFWRVNFSFLWCSNLTRFVLEAMRNSLNWLQGRCVLVLLSVYLIHAMYAYYRCSPLEVNHTK